MSVAMLATAALVGCCSECKKEECNKKECAENVCPNKGCNEVAFDKQAAIVDNIMTRRSIRDYKDEPVNREQMAKVLECGIYAPSAINMQAWAVRVVDSKEFIDGVTQIAVNQDPQLLEQEGFRNIFRNGAAVIFVGAPEGKFAGENIGCLGQNIMLAATELGLGTCFLGSAQMIFAEPEMAKYVASLGFSEGYTLRYALAVGYPDESPEAKPRDLTKIKFVE